MEVISAIRARPRTQRTQDVAHAAVVDVLRADLAAPSEPRVNTMASTPSTAAERVRARDVADDYLRLRGKLTRLAWVRTRARTAWP